MKYFYLVLGWLFFVTGVIGAFLPVLPTTIFMILALWAFSKSSKKFHNWLYSHRIFGPSLQQWQQYKVIPIRAKIIAVIMISSSMIYLYYYQIMSFALTLLIEIVMLIVIIYILSKPSKVPTGIK
ncbi:MAG: YbaN family protein [Thiohalomonadales bacterium]